MKNAFIIALTLLLLVAPASAYTVTINSADFVTGNTINPSSADVNGVLQLADPFATFVNVPENSIVNVTNAATGYLTDEDQLYFDAALRDCTTEDPCTASSNTMSTSCDLTTTNGVNMYQCTVTDSQGTQAFFFFNPDNDRVGYINFLSPVGLGTAPVISANVSPSEGFAPLVVTFTNTVFDDEQVDSVIWTLSDGTVRAVNPTDSFSHTFLQDGLYTARIQATDNDNITSEQLFEIVVDNNFNPPTPEQPFNDGVLFNLSVSTADWNGGLTLNPSMVALNNGAAQTAAPFADFFNVRSNTVHDISNAATGYIADVDNYYFDFQLPTCAGDECTLSSRNIFGQTFVTECELEGAIYQCSVQNSGFTTFFQYNPVNDRIGIVNFLVSDLVNSTGTPPTLFANVNPSSGDAPLNVTFSASVTDDNSVDRVEWFFGDGTSQRVGNFSNINHIYGAGGTYTARLAAWDNEGLLSTQDFTIVVDGTPNPRLFPHDPTVLYNVTVSTADWNGGTTLPSSTVTLSVVGGNTITQAANPFAHFFGIHSDTVYDVTNAAAGYGTDVDQYYFDHNLSSCTGPSCTLQSRNIHGAIFSTYCELNNQTTLYECEVSNNGLHTFYQYNPANNRIGLTNFLVNDSTPDNAPTIFIGASETTGEAPFEVTLQNSVSDPDGINRTLWFFGDGSSQYVNAVDEIQHTFEQPGIYNVQLVTWDNLGFASSKNLTITATRFGKLPEGERQSIFIRSVRIDNAEDLLPGDDVLVHLTFENDGDKKIKSVKATASIPELGIRASQGTSLTLYENEDRRESLLLYLPKDTPPGTYWVRIQIKGGSTDRVMHREIVVKEPIVAPRVGVYM